MLPVPVSRSDFRCFGRYPCGVYLAFFFLFFFLILCFYLCYYHAVVACVFCTLGDVDGNFTIIITQIQWLYSINDLEAKVSQPPLLAYAICHTSRLSHMEYHVSSTCFFFGHTVEPIRCCCLKDPFLFYFIVFGSRGVYACCQRFNRRYLIFLMCLVLI